MRLRYLAIPDLPPLKDIAIPFGQEQILGHKCAIHFVVGINGTGKSRLLRAIAEIFLHLERFKVPPFSVSIAYDLERKDFGEKEQRTIYYHYPGSGGYTKAYLLEMPPIPLNDFFDWEGLPKLANWVELEKHPLIHRRYLGNDSGITPLLPKIMLVYTSGAAHEWERTFAPYRPDLEQNISLNYPEISLESERPLNWNSLKEAELEQRERKNEAVAAARLSEPPSGDEALHNRYSIGYFIQPATLKLVVCAVALSQAYAEYNEYNEYAARAIFAEKIGKIILERQHMGALRDLFNEIDWLWPVNIRLRIALQPESILDRRTIQLLTRLYRIATVTHREPRLNHIRNLFFDLERILRMDDIPAYDTRRTLFALTEILSDNNTQAFPIFQQLEELQRQGILEDISIGLKKRNVEGVLLFDWLSDGERLYLGRMALFHLLTRQNDSLIILDEPETHFNDAWKRVVTDIIDRNLRDCSSEVVLATHSSIALTDVFDSELVVLHKDIKTGTISASGPSIRSFGASPSEILRDIFQAPESIGQRASQFLSIMLIAVSHESQTLNIWGMNGSDRDIYRHKDFRRLSQLIRAEMSYNGEEVYPGNGEPEGEFHEQILRTLRAAKTYTQQQIGHQDITMLDVINTLLDLIGPGYHQLEFRRRLLALRERRGLDAS